MCVNNALTRDLRNNTATDAIKNLSFYSPIIIETNYILRES